MFFKQADKQAKPQKSRAAATTKGRGPVITGGRRLYTVPVWMQGRVFAGEFEIAGRKYGLTYAPTRAEIIDGALRLHGRLRAGAGRPEVKEVGARLAGIQGGIGSGPARYRMEATGATPGPTQSPTEKQQKAGETDKKAGEPARPEPTAGLPRTENSGPNAFTAVMYFHLDAVDGRAVGVPADMSGVQLNARLAPKDPLAQQLHSLYTALTGALAGAQADAATAAALVRELNRILAG